MLLTVVTVVVAVAVVMAVDVAVVMAVAVAAVVTAVVTAEAIVAPVSPALPLPPNDHSKVSFLVKKRQIDPYRMSPAIRNGQPSLLTCQVTC